MNMFTKSPSPSSVQALCQRNDQMINTIKEKTTNENNLSKALQDANELSEKLSSELKILQEKYEKLYEKMNIMQDRMACNVNKDSPELSTVDPIEYNTDEDELAEETQWLVQERRKKTQKRKASVTPENPPRSKAGARGETDSRNNVKKSHPERDELAKRKRPPPINVTGIKNYEELYHVLFEGELRELITTKDANITIMNNGIFKINTYDVAIYRAIVDVLTESNISYFTYENKHLRPIKVMARGIRSSCDPDNIKSQLAIADFKIMDVTNFMKYERDPEDSTQKIKTRLPLFMLTFNPEDDINKIFEIKTIKGMNVKIEALKKKTTVIPQCKKCQGFGHTRSYCKKNARCVKCAGEHLTADCKVSRNVKAKCYNCGGQHPASYRGCDVAVALQKRRNELISDRTRKNAPTRNSYDTKDLPKVDDKIKMVEKLLQQQLERQHIRRY